MKISVEEPTVVTIVDGDTMTVIVFAEDHLEAEYTKPEDDEDYFIGGVLESEAILQCCLAVAENEQDEVIGVQTQKAVDMVQQLIRKDMGIAPDTVGEVQDGNIRKVDIFAYRKLWIPQGKYTVYGQVI